MEQNLLIPQALAQAIVNYLAQQPYADVVNLVSAMTRLQPAPTVADPKTEQDA